MKLVPFDRYNCIIVNSFQDLKSHLGIPNGLVFSFEEYVKSQVHFPLMVYKPGRTIEQYLETYKFLVETNSQFSSDTFDDFVKVVRYFYEDLSSTMLNCSPSEPDNFNFYINFNVEGLAPKRNLKEEDMSTFLMSSSNEPIYMKKAKILQKLSAKGSSFLLVDM